MGDMGGLIAGLLITLIICFVIFLIMRELMCWYWKINEGILLLKSIDRKLSSKSNSENLTISETETSNINTPVTENVNQNRSVTIGGKEYTALDGYSGTAVCAQCGVSGDKSSMLYCRETNKTYHKNCVNTFR